MVVSRSSIVPVAPSDRLRLLFLNLPAATTKKASNALYWSQSSMNLGLLSVASAAAEAGHQVDVLDWLGPQQVDLPRELPAILADRAPQIVGLSMPSGYGEGHCAPVSSLVADHAPGAKLIVGGQYHAGMRPRAILDRFPRVDAVVTGAGEQLDWRALLASGGASQPGVVTRRTLTPTAGSSSRDHAPHLRFDLHRLDRRSYAPSIEFARGCPFTCSFCSLSGAPTDYEKPLLASVGAQIAWWLDVWPELPSVPIFFECPVFFCAKASQLEVLGDCLAPFRGRIRWRTQCRAESVAPELLPGLARTGLTVLDLGLESASPTMLERMNKTKTPDSYLRDAQRLIDAAHDAGVKIKLNILLYAGETMQTAAETEAFILKNREKIAGISACPAIGFPGSELLTSLPELEARHGTKARPDPALSESGIVPLDLSHDFPLEVARTWCLRVTRSVTTAEAYFTQKSTGYFRPDFSYEDFLRAARSADPAALPFVLPEQSATSAETSWDQAEWDRLR